MKRMLLAFRDVKTARFYSPLTAATPGEAERIAVECWKNEATQVGKYPNDFPLYVVGSYDDETGSVAGLYSDSGVVEAPRVFVEAASLLSLRKEG